MKEEETLLKRRFQSLLPKYGTLWRSMAPKGQSFLSAIEKKEPIQINLQQCDERDCFIFGCEDCKPPLYDEIVEETCKPGNKEFNKENSDIISFQNRRSEDNEADLVDAMAKFSIGDSDDQVDITTEKQPNEFGAFHEERNGYETRSSWVEDESLNNDSKDELWDVRSHSNDHVIIVESDSEIGINDKKLVHANTASVKAKEREKEKYRDVNTSLGSQSSEDVLEAESESDGEFWEIPTARPENTAIIIDSDSDNESDSDSNNSTNTKITAAKTMPNTTVMETSHNIIVLSDYDSDHDGDQKQKLHKAKPRSTRARTSQVQSFQKHRESLTKRVFSEFNERVFSLRLGSVNVEWTNKLRTTAGITRLKQRSYNGKETQRIASIELNTKVIDEYHRLRSTLLHEMCHAAQWLIDGNMKPHHGRVFKKWANIAMNRIHDVTVTTTHNYEIQFKFAWACQTEKCGAIIKRQSRSVDPLKQCCGRCKGTLVEINVPRKGQLSIDRTPRRKGPLSSYNVFIKQHAAIVRTKLQLQKREKVTQSDVMRECARLWRDRNES